MTSSASSPNVGGGMAAEDMGLIERAQTLISNNKKAAAAVAAVAVVAVGVSVYYVSSSGNSSSSPRSPSSSSSPRSKKKSKKTKENNGNNAAAPIIEERKKKVVEEKDVLDLKALSTEQIFAMSDEERNNLAKTCKAKGNEAYQLRNFELAAECYSKAIEVTPQAEPVYFSNRAACYVNMTPSQYDKVVEDCDQALKLDPKYIKALNRRAMALEGLQKYQDALRDFTAATILLKFQDNPTSNSVERVLKKLSMEQTAEILKTREPKLPSFTFVSAYFAAFRPRSPPSIPTTEGQKEGKQQQGDQTLILAFEALEAKDYIHAASLVSEAVEQGISWDQGKAEALNLRGTFRFLTGQVESAKDDLISSIKLSPSFTQSHVKLASVYMEQSNAEKAFECFEEAKKHDPKDPDIYYHLGQVLFIMEDYNGAAENYTKSSELDDSFVFSHIQLAVAQYKAGNLGSSMATFRRTLRQFPQRSEPHNYYGELLLDQSRFEEAIEKFDKAIEVEKTKPRQNVLPLVNKGLALYQFTQSMEAAEQCCQEALAIDPECDAAVATLAQLSLQQSKVQQACDLFKKQCDLARTEPELLNALSYMNASVAQLAFMENYPSEAAELGKLASAMAGAGPFGPVS